MKFPYDEKIIRYLTGRYQLGGVLPDDGYITGVSKNIENEISSVNSAAGPGLSTLHTYSLPARSLKSNGCYLDLLYLGFYAANDNDKRINASFDGTAYEAVPITIDLDGGADTGWMLYARVTRLSATSVLVGSHWPSQFMSVTSPGVAGSGGVGGLVIARNKTFNVANLDTNAVTILLQGEGTAVGDVVKNLASFGLTRF